MRDLAGEELEEALQLLSVAAQCGSQFGRVEPLGGLERADLELQAVPKAIDPSEDAHGVAFREAAVEKVDVAPDPALDPATRIDELDGEVRRAAPRPEPLLPGDRVDALDNSVLLELGDRRHESSLGLETDATVRSSGRDQAVSRASLRH
jgi:hypothetical protein